jgi:predicted molibdopterin-dependent oxidoreductase YjgC
MFKRIEGLEPENVVIFIEGEKVMARSGDTVAAAMLAAGHTQTRTSAISDTKRGPFCMMGICFDCLVEINGVANRQACQTLVQNDMQVRIQKGAREIKS